MYALSVMRFYSRLSFFAKILSAAMNRPADTATDSISIVSMVLFMTPKTGTGGIISSVQTLSLIHI